MLWLLSCLGGLLTIGKCLPLSPFHVHGPLFLQWVKLQYKSFCLVILDFFFWFFFFCHFDYSISEACSFLWGSECGVARSDKAGTSGGRRMGCIIWENNVFSKKTKQTFTKYKHIYSAHIIEKIAQSHLKEVKYLHYRWVKLLGLTSCAICMCSCVRTNEVGTRLRVNLKCHFSFLELSC